jgi:hypothetical protein
LLLTLLAVPVFYSLFDDAGESRYIRGIGGRVSSVIAAIFKRSKSATGSSNKRTEFEDPVNDRRDGDGEARTPAA